MNNAICRSFIRNWIELNKPVSNSLLINFAFHLNAKSSFCGKPTFGGGGDELISSLLIHRLIHNHSFIHE